MASPNDMLLTNANYFSWKYRMEDVLQSKGLYHITLGKEKFPTNATKKVKWNNKNDEACGLIRMFISSDLWFRLQGINALDESWVKLEVVFGKHNEIRAHHIENQSIYLNPNNFFCIEYYLSKIKTPRILLADCKI